MSNIRRLRLEGFHTAAHTATSVRPRRASKDQQSGRTASGRQRSHRNEVTAPHRGATLTPCQQKKKRKRASDDHDCYSSLKLKK